MKKLLNNRQNHGITLVALVITIIVLLILAGITINLTIGENGITTTVQEAKQKTNIATFEEKIQLIFAEYNVDNTINITEKLKDELNIKEENIDKLATGIYAIKLTDEKVAILKLATSKITYTNIWTGEIATDFASGDGTEENPYTIETPQQLAYLAQYVNEGNTMENQYIKLNNDIMLNWNVLNDEFGLNSGEYNYWTPIGYLENVNNVDGAFKGKFNGNNYIISGVYTTRTAGNYNHSYLGLFGIVGYITFPGGTSISSLGVVDSYIYGYQAGGIVGYASCTMEKCFFSGNVTGAYSCGGVVDVARGAVAKNLFIEGNANCALGDYIGKCTLENLIVSSDEYTLIDFMKQYSQ
jgi:hypothetical protein